MKEIHPMLVELKALLDKYKADISFTCSEGSDTYGLYNDHIEITSNTKTIFKANGWYIHPNDLV